MFEIKNNKTIMDPIHGYITIPKCLIEHLVDDEYFQRLRNIDQTGMKVLYHSAKHDRFSHSIGVFHLGQKAVNNLLENFHSFDFFKDLNELFWKKNKILFLIACLLHDIGHTPFSHSLENIVLDNSKVIAFNKDKEKSPKKKISITKQLSIIINHYENNNDNTLENTIEKEVSAHEQMGSLLILTELKEKIRAVFSQLINEKFFALGNVDDVLSNTDYCFIARMIMGTKYDSHEIEKQIKNCFIDLLNGENFDVDNLDYIVRDTKMSGISNINVDVERLINSICIVPKTRHTNKVSFANKIGKINNLIITKISNNNELTLNANIKGSIILYKGTKVTIKKESFFEGLTGIDNEFASLSYVDGNQVLFNEKTQIFTENGELHNERVNGSPVKFLRGKQTGESFKCSIKNACLISDFTFNVIDDCLLSFHGKCNIHIYETYNNELSFSSNSIISLFNIEEISGTINEIEILGITFNENYTEKKIPDKNNYILFSIAYDKKAVNLIANVLKARNYLYLWIYAHHKVIYYANFALPVIAKNLPIKQQWKFDYDNIKFIDDYYLWTEMKKYYYNSKSKNPEINDIAKELLNHKYKKSLYKSLIEYDIIFEKYNKSEKNKIWNLIQDNINKKKINLKRTDKGKVIFDAGYLKNKFINIINNYLNEENRITELVFVSANYKEKVLKAQKAYIRLNENNYVSFSQIPLFSNDINTTSKNDNSYFYLYYSRKNNNKTLNNKIIIDALIKYFDKVIQSNK